MLDIVTKLKSLIKRSIRFLGFDLRRYSPGLSDHAQFVEMLKQHGVNLVFDIGANTGQFGKQLRDAGYSGRIVSFEPLSSARKELLSTSLHDVLWEVAPQAAIGNEDGEVEIHVSANSASSSVLNMLDLHANVAPESRYISVEKVKMCCLDTIAQGFVNSDSILFIKIDVQGFEDRVLQGANILLAKAVGLQLELSLVPLYEGQLLFDEMITKLKNLGFNLWGISPAFVDPKSGRLLQIDATFFRE